MFNCGRRNEYEPIGFSFQKLNIADENNVYDVYAYNSKNYRKLIIFHLLAVFSLGFLYILVNWYPQLQSLKLKKCYFNVSDILLIRDANGNYDLIPIKKIVVHLPQIRQNTIKYFIYRHSKYILDEHDKIFKSLDSFLPKVTLNNLLEDTNGVTENEKHELLNLFGSNEINVEVKSYWNLFVNEVFTPFYLFQLLSIILWCSDEYAVYAICVLFLTIVSIGTTLYQTRKQSKALHKLVKSSTTDIATVLRPNTNSDHSVYEIPSTEIVPGDLLIIPRSGCIVPCDAALLSGNCIVNESMLTGESTPVTKTPPHSSSESFNISTHKRHTLFCGTHILQARFYGGEYVLARALTTGFETMKGELVKSILYPVPINLQFYKDSMKFLFSLSVIAICGMGYCIYLYHSRGASIGYIIIRTLDIITIVVPPALPAAMNIGITYSQNRLKKLNIFCTSPPRINLAGKINLACFDKTGTLTEDGLELKSVVPCVDGKFLESISNVCKMAKTNIFMKAMATCHSLTRIEGQLTGDPLDLSMFQSTKWEIEEPGENESNRYDMLAPVIVKPKEKSLKRSPGVDEVPYGIGIIRQFPFSSNQQCMSVICRELGDPCMLAFSKGAPEKIKSFCIEESLPNDYALRLAEYTSKGFRVIALATKKMPSKFKWKESQKIKREAIECDMTFLGFIIMQNSLKTETAPVIKSLHHANVRTVMITGDNIMTAICVARDCEMVNSNESIVLVNMEIVNESEIPKITFEVLGNDRNINFQKRKFHLAIDGKNWSKLREFYPDYLPNILVHSTIFARFQPDQKTQLVNYFQKLGHIVSMVGDGANDCGALKAAHVGVSLSQTEASVAAPFTSSIPDISCIVHLILEGRCTLVTSFALFKYMALYSLIQFCSILILYSYHSIMGNIQLLFVDLVITTSLAVTIGYQGPARKLQTKRPMGSLVSLRNLIPLVAQIILCICVQLSAYFYLTTQSWFVPLPPGKEEVVKCWENTVIFIVSAYQYLTMAMAFAKGKPFRQRLITNYSFLFTVISLGIFITWLFVCPVEKVANYFEIIYLPNVHSKEQEIFRGTLLILPIIHFILAIIIEGAIAEREWFRKLLRCLRRKKTPKKQYKLLLRNNVVAQWLSNPEFNVSLTIEV